MLTLLYWVLWLINYRNWWFSCLNDKIITFNAFIKQLFILLKFSFICCDKDLKRCLFRENLNFFSIKVLKFLIEMSYLTSNISLIFINIRIISVKNKIWDFSLLLFFSLYFLFENIFKIFILLFWGKEFTPVR